MLAIILGTIAYYTLKFYYPNYMNKRLKNLRYKPRISPKTGKPMKLLTEEEEDVYLDEGMQAEEDVFSIDYDVWIDEETGFTQIEKYSGKLTAKECPRCGYQTLKVEKEELIIAPTAFASGELMKRYKCTYCGHKEKEIFKVAKLTEEH
jgi:DNA-directed RNA polymerase subunit RPC12/RpoP